MENNNFNSPYLENARPINYSNISNGRTVALDIVLNNDNIPKQFSEQSNCSPAQRKNERIGKIKSIAFSLLLVVIILSIHGFAMVDNKGKEPYFPSHVVIRSELIPEIRKKDVIINQPAEINLAYSSENRTKHLPIFSPCK